jgi:hypothetical protein
MMYFHIITLHHPFLPLLVSSNSPSFGNKYCTNIHTHTHTYVYILYIYISLSKPGLLQDEVFQFHTCNYEWQNFILFFWLNYIPYRYNIFSIIHPFWEHGWFVYILTIVNSASVMQVDLLYPDLQYFGYIPRSGIAGSYSSFTFSFCWAVSILFSIVVVLIYIPTNSVWQLPPIFSPKNSFVFFFEWFLIAYNKCTGGI